MVGPSCWCLAPEAVAEGCCEHMSLRGGNLSPATWSPSANPHRALPACQQGESSLLTRCRSLAELQYTGTDTSMEASNSTQFLPWPGVFPLLPLVEAQASHTPRGVSTVDSLTFSRVGQTVWLLFSHKMLWKIPNELFGQPNRRGGFHTSEVWVEWQIFP